MQRTAYAAIVPFVFVAGCSMAPDAKQPLVQGPSVSIQTGPSLASPEGPAPSSAAADCAGITSQQGGGSAYLNCVERHE
jgi:hypothetical protein